MTRPDCVVDVNFGPGADLPLHPDAVADAVQAVLGAEGVDRARISVTFLTDPEIARLNEEYLSHLGPTDVISFPLHPPGGPPVGDVYIGVEQARRQADELGVQPIEELLRLAIHGTLHVLGYEHPEGDDRFGSPMYERQEALLASVLARHANT